MAPAAPPPPPVEDPGPTGPGWVIELRCHHYHNKQLDSQGFVYVRDTLIKKLRNAEITLVGKDGQSVKIPIKDLGIGYPVIPKPIEQIKVEQFSLASPKPATPASPAAPNAPPTGPTVENKLALHRFNFLLQFAWQPTPFSKRQEIQDRRAKASRRPAVAADAPPQSN